MYHALYRKYRPMDFNAVVGQESIVKTLQNSIKNSKFSHAYLFYGPRGTGKTTISKIFARNVNCLNSKDGLACGKCSACQVSFSKECVDIIEIDAASNNGVDEIRNLKNKISLVPSELKFKVYIIDEVHMLSIGAFNALLKTLEEPPDHAIFILATTDYQKVPATIVSRCQCFSFKRIENSTIIKKLKEVCKNEEIEIDDDVLKKIALLSDGGLRDALGSLDKLVSYSDEKITLEIFNELNGIVSDDEIITFLGFIFNGNIADVLKKLNDFNTKGKNLIQIILQCMEILRNLIVDYYISKKEPAFSIDKAQIFITLLNEKMFDIKRSSNTKIYIEIFILKFINDHILVNDKLKNNSNITKYTKENNLNNVDKSNDQFNINLNNVDKSNDQFNINLNNVENFSKFSKNIIQNHEIKKDNDLGSDSKVNNSLFSVNKAYGLKHIKNIDEIMKIRVNNTFVSANKNLLKDELKKFESLRDYTFDQEYGYIVCYILDGNLRLVGDDSIVISYEYESNVNQNLNIIDKISEIYNMLTKSNKKIAIISDDYWDKVKNEYIDNKKNNIKYNFVEEPEVVFEEIKNDDIISNSAIDLFGDIVEVD